MIPRVIHQIWIGTKPRPSTWMDTWKEKNPSFEYVLWDNVRCASFKFKNQQKIDEAREWCGKADIIRYEILERFGGIYIDADSECIRPLDDELLQHECWACYESETQRPGLIANGYLGAEVESSFMAHCSEVISKRDVRIARAWVMTGPGLVTQLASFHPELHIYPSYLWIPEHYSGEKQEGPDEPYARQFWTSTFEERRGRIA